MEYEFPKRKFKVAQSYICLNQNELDLGVGSDFEKIQISNRQLYFDKIMAPIYDASSKNLERDHAPEYNEIPVLGKYVIQGPIKSEDAEKMLYISAETLGETMENEGQDPCFKAIIIPFPDQNRIIIHGASHSDQNPNEINTFVFNKEGNIFS